uniref:Uncharacterized protein n=1 Tax=viral metagenome TaxID=1070528 RepID=A0A6C0BDP5_9ZZZZ
MEWLVIIICIVILIISALLYIYVPSFRDVIVIVIGVIISILLLFGLYKLFKKMNNEYEIDTTNRINTQNNFITRLLN